MKAPNGSWCLRQKIRLCNSFDTLPFIRIFWNIFYTIMSLSGSISCVPCQALAPIQPSSHLTCSACTCTCKGFVHMHVLYIAGCKCLLLAPGMFSPPVSQKADATYQPPWKNEAIFIAITKVAVVKNDNLMIIEWQKGLNAFITSNTTTFLYVLT